MVVDSNSVAVTKISDTVLVLSKEFLYVVAISEYVKTQTIFFQMVMLRVTHKGIDNSNYGLHLKKHE